MDQLRRIGALCIISALVVAACFFISSKLYAEPEEITFCVEKARGPVLFSHERHTEAAECLDCHHVYDNGENVLDEGDLEDDDPAVKCAHCHNAEAKIVDTREAFHRLCIGCHDKSKLTTTKTGPGLCGGCHILPKE